jgi:CheY-like chemotaxis protein
VVQGLDFIEELRQKQCRCPSFALMSGSWSPEDMHRAHDLGCELFSKPFTVPMLKNWLETVEHRASSLPELTDWDVPGSGSASDS